MMSRHFGLRLEFSGSIAKRLPHTKNQLSEPDIFFNQFVTDIYIYIIYLILWTVDSPTQVFKLGPIVYY